MTNQSLCTSLTWSNTLERNLIVKEKMTKAATSSARIIAVIGLGLGLGLGFRRPLSARSAVLLTGCMYGLRAFAVAGANLWNSLMSGLEVGTRSTGTPLSLLPPFFLPPVPPLPIPSCPLPSPLPPLPPHPLPSPPLKSRPP